MIPNILFTAYCTAYFSLLILCLLLVLFHLRLLQPVKRHCIREDTNPTDIVTVNSYGFGSLLTYLSMYSQLSVADV